MRKENLISFFLFILFVSTALTARDDLRASISTLKNRIQPFQKGEKWWFNNLGEALTLETMKKLRVVSRGIRPLIQERLGIPSAIASPLNEIDGKKDIFCTNDIQNVDRTLNQEISLPLYRIIQEVLMNVVKHPSTRTTLVTREHIGNAVEIPIRDIGIGFNFSKKLRDAKSLGVKTCMERVKIQSKLYEKSKVFKGTAVSLLIPAKNGF